MTKGRLDTSRTKYQKRNIKIEPMGYYTNHTINVSAPTEETSKGVFKEILDSLGDPFSETKAEKLASQGETEIEAKWYDRETALKAISKRFPDAIITVHGYGEEPGDVWAERWKSGDREFHRVSELPGFSRILLPDERPADQRGTEIIIATCVTVRDLDIPECETKASTDEEEIRKWIDERLDESEAELFDKELGDLNDGNAHKELAKLESITSKPYERIILYDGLGNSLQLIITKQTL